jgi:hypothetical protein
MGLFARKPGGSAEICDPAPDLAFLALEPLGFCEASCSKQAFTNQGASILRIFHGNSTVVD